MDDRALRIVLGAVAAGIALIFVLGALLHTGVPLGPLREPVIVPATIAETVCGLALLAAAWGALGGRAWAWRGLRAGYTVALAGVLVGTLALALGRGEATVLNTWYHGTVATVLIAGLGAQLYRARR
ncbi:hypothetical protein ACIBG7_29550 [Nonomuraea sp. NPDC050328]|uniref:hypothetical protein n=1 Tax=Nonomuraea sp. NPDC050328 TaxID=3364361 RepID=UPI0037951E64